MGAPKTTQGRFGLCIIVGILVLVAGCRQDITVPSFFIGTWKTASPKYEDRYIQFSQKTLVFGVGENKENEHLITSIKLEGKGAMRLYTFMYTDTNGDSWPFSILYNPHYNDGVFQLKNGQEVWQKMS